MSWERLDGIRESAKARAEASLKDDEELNASYVRVFDTPEGRLILRHLRKRTSARIPPDDTRNCALWYQEGQRQMLADILTRVANGLGIDALDYSIRLDAGK